MFRACFWQGSGGHVQCKGLNLGGLSARQVPFLLPYLSCPGFCCLKTICLNQGVERSWVKLSKWNPFLVWAKHINAKQTKLWQVSWCLERGFKKDQLEYFRDTWNHCYQFTLDSLCVLNFLQECYYWNLRFHEQECCYWNTAAHWAMLCWTVLPLSWEVESGLTISCNPGKQTGCIGSARCVTHGKILRRQH